MDISQACQTYCVQIKILIFLLCSTSHPNSVFPPQPFSGQKNSNAVLAVAKANNVTAILDFSSLPGHIESFNTS